MTVSMDQSKLALLTDTCVLWTTDLTNLQNVAQNQISAVGLIEISLTDIISGISSGDRPKQMIWCANTEVIIYHNEQLYVINSEKEYMEFFYNLPVFITSEIDGCRIISSNMHQLFQPVPVSLENLGKFGTDSPAAFLYEALEELQNQGSVKVHEFLQATFREICRSSSSTINAFSPQVQTGLREPILQCMQAALEAWDVKHQKSFLRAARLGRGYLLKDELGDEFSLTCTLLQLLNYLRSPNGPVALPLTHKQLQVLGYSQLINRLLMRKHYPVAIKVAQLLNIPPKQGIVHILTYWANQRIRKPISGQNSDKNVDTMEEATRLAGIIHEQISSLGRNMVHVSFAEIAISSLECNRRILAEKIIEFEPRIGQRVNFWLRIENYNKALASAMDSHDSQLIIFTLESIREKISNESKFINLIRNYPTAVVLLRKQFLVSTDQTIIPSPSSPNERVSFEKVWSQLLVNLAKFEESPLEVARANLKQSFSTPNLKDRKKKLIIARDNFKSCNNNFMAEECDQQLKLLDVAYDLTVNRNQPINVNSINVFDLVERTFELNNNKLTEQIRRDLKVSDRTLWFLNLNTSARLHLWAEIDKLSKSRRKLPIGFEEFVRVCLEMNNLDEAEKYLNKTDPSKKTRLLFKMDRVNDAINFASSQKCDKDFEYLLWNLSTPDRKREYDRVQNLRNQL